MLKILRTHKIYTSINKFNNFLKLFSASTTTNQLTLLPNNYERRRHRYWNKNEWWFSDNAHFLSIGVPLVITAVVCDSPSKHNEKRFFRAVQYGMEDEVKR